jgi:hypothetical protein
MSAVVCWAFGTPILLSVAHCKKNYADMISRQEQQRQLHSVQLPVHCTIMPVVVHLLLY